MEGMKNWMGIKVLKWLMMLGSYSFILCSWKHQKQRNGGFLMNMYFTIFSVILLFGLIATFMIGFSSKNVEGDQTYFQKTGVKWVRLTAFYVIAIAAGLLALLAYIRNLNI
jgi:hypothetical protein